MDSIKTKAIVKLNAVSTAALRPRIDDIPRTNINGSIQSRKAKYTRNMFLTDFL